MLPGVWSLPAAIDIDLVRALFPSWVRMFDMYNISVVCWYPARMNLSK